MRLRIGLAVVGALVMSGCAGGESTPAAQMLVSPTPSPSQGPALCSVVLVDGAPVTKAIIAAGCVEPVDGSITSIPAFVCIGGSQLASPDYSGGHFWGVTGGTWHKVASTDNDPAYGAAYSKCNA